MWDSRVVEKVKECVGEYTVACSFRNVENQFTWAFASVYGPNCDCDRSFLWDELVGLVYVRTLGEITMPTRFPSDLC